MLKPSIDDLLTSSELRTDTCGIRSAVTDMVRDSRPTSSSRRRPLLAVPVFGLAGLAGLTLTGGAVAVDSALNPDVSIPVAYTTDTGVYVNCTIYVEGGSLLNPGSNVFGAYLADQDWSGVGQRMYFEALRISASGGGGGLTAAERDQWGWYSAEHALTVGTVPAALISEGDHAVSTSDCTGQLH